MIGFHIQDSPNFYLDAVKLMAPGTLVKFTSGWERAIEVKQTNPNVKTWARHVVPQPMPTSNYEEVARNYFRGMVDTKAEHWRHMDYVQGWNEFYANSQQWDEKKHWVATDIAFAKVWAEEYRPLFPKCRFVMSEPGVGNDIPWQVAEASIKYDALLGYHPYIPVYKKQLSPADEWLFYSGRWQAMDISFRNRGFLVDWIFGEMGPYQSTISGWRHSDVLNRDLERYKHFLHYWMDKTSKTLAWKEGRVYGGVLFTCGAPGSGPNWNYFEHDTEEMKEIAKFVATYSPTLPPPVVTPPDPPTPPPADSNDLVNGSFELTGWDHIYEDQRQQIPQGYGLVVGENGEVVRGRKVNVQPEIVHKDQIGENPLPPNEWRGEEDALILDGVRCLKMFGKGVWYALLTQTITDLPPGKTVRFTCPVNCHFDGRPDDYDTEDTMLMIGAGNKSATVPMLKEFDRRWMEMYVDAVIPDNGEIEVYLDVSVKWDHDTAVFLDALRIDVLSGEGQDGVGAPRIQYKRKYHALRQDAPLSRLLEIAEIAFQEKATVGFSYDDGGIGALDDKTVVLWDIAENKIEEFTKWYEKWYSNTKLEFRQ